MYNIILLSVLILSAYSTTSSTDSCQTPQALLTGTIYRVVDRYWTASGSLNSTYPPYEARLNGNGWCANRQGFSIPWLQVEFGTPVLISSFEIHGDDELGYIHSFQFQYKEKELFISHPEIFTLKNTSETQMINISEPFIGSTIRLQPITWSSLTPCVRMEMYGCLANPVCPGELWSYEVTLMDSKMSDEDFTFYMEFATPFILRSITSNVSETDDLEIEFWIELVPYRDFTNTSVFNVSDVFTFWYPILQVNSTISAIVTSTSGLNISSEESDMNIAAVFYGCNASDEIFSTLTPTPSMSSSSLSSSSVSSSLTLIYPSPSVVTEVDYLLLVAGVPLAVGTIVIVMFLAICCIAYSCYLQKTAKTPKQRMPPPSITTLQESSNSLTLRSLKNRLYESVETDGLHIQNKNVTTPTETESKTHSFMSASVPEQRGELLFNENNRKLTATYDSLHHVRSISSTDSGNTYNLYAQ